MQLLQSDPNPSVKAYFTGNLWVNNRPFSNMRAGILKNY